MMLKFVIFFISLFLLHSCSESTPKNEQTNEVTETVTLENYYKLSGYAQGTTYTVVYQDSLQRDFYASVDSILVDYDMYCSIYVDSSVISRWNKSEIVNLGDIYVANNHFVECFNYAKEVYENTGGAFNPAVYPLVKAYGFIDSTSEDIEITKKLLQTIDFGSLDVDVLYEGRFFKSKLNFPKVNADLPKNGTVFLTKKFDETKIDFNAIAQGHSVDVVSAFLISKGIENYMVEIGGEVYTKGMSSSNEKWKIGIDKPIENSKPGENLEFIASLSGYALATSGSYRKFYEKDGMKFSHTISPFTCKPVQHNLLSVTVITDNCALADGYATAFMVMGRVEAMKFIKEHPELNIFGYFIEEEKGELKTYKTLGFDAFILGE